MSACRRCAPDLICLRVMGGANGAPAVDYTVNAAVGVPYMTGHSDDERPVNHVLPAWDLMAGAYSAFALLAAERERQASGRGRELRLALSDLAAATLGESRASGGKSVPRGRIAHAAAMIYLERLAATFSR